MGTSGIARFAPLTGFLAVALGVLAAILAWTWSDEPGSKDSAAEFAAWMTDKSWAILVSAWVWWLAVAAFVWFLASLRVVLRRGEGGDARVTSIVYGSGLVFAAFAASFFVPVAAGASANEFDERAITPQVAETLWVLGNGIFGAAEIAAGLLALSTATVVLRTAALPKWYGWLGGVYGIWLLIIPIGWIGMIGLPIWMLLTTLLVWNAETKMPTAAGAAV